MQASTMTGWASSAALVLFTFGAVQAPPPAGAPAERMALIVEFADGRVTHQPVGPVRGSSWTPMFPRVPEWRPAPGHLQVSAIRRSFRRTEQGLRLTVSVLLGDAHEQEVTVYEGTLTLGDRVTVTGLLAYGVQPIVVGLDPLAAVEFHEPAIVNLTSGLHVAAIEVVVDPAPRYVITVENVTDRGADGFAVESRRGGRVGHSGTQGNEDGRVLVPPRETYAFDFPFPTGPGPSHEPWTPVPADEIALTSVTWDDGSFEGRPGPAAISRLRRMARRVQVERVVQSLRLAVADGAVDRAVRRLRRDIDALSIQVDTALERQGMALLPTADAMPREGVVRLVRSILQRVKSQASDQVAGIERAGSGGTGGDTRQALEKMAREFDVWLAQLQR